MRAAIRWGLAAHLGPWLELESSRSLQPSGERAAVRWGRVLGGVHTARHPLPLPPFPPGTVAVGRRLGVSGHGPHLRTVTGAPNPVDETGMGMPRPAGEQASVCSRTAGRSMMALRLSGRPAP